MFRRVLVFWMGHWDISRVWLWGLESLERKEKGENGEEEERFRE
jgi:hypothetical protein